MSLKQVTLHFRLCRLSKLLCISHGQVSLQLLPIDFKLLLCTLWIHVGIGVARSLLGNAKYADQQITDHGRIEGC